MVENVRDKAKQKFICEPGTFHRDETDDIKKFIEFGEEFILKEKNRRKEEKKEEDTTVSLGYLVELGANSVYV